MRVFGIAPDTAMKYGKAAHPHRRGQQVGGAADVGGDGAGCAGEQQGDLLEVRGWQARVSGSSGHGFDEALVELLVADEAAGWGCVGG
ncbi:hypothetical protein [Streptomyces sp. NPDC006610]|uniref:hypothetical protein n=1 Tax=Streptomyces sp. NPDC006610 TaxID=3154584 RepID=UPI0033B4FCAC